MVTETQSLPRPTREQVFRANILAELSGSAASTDITSIEQTNLSILKELYPNLWYFGPRGSIYLQQLDRIETIIDEIHEGNRDTTFVTEFAETFATFLRTQSLTQHVSKQTKLLHYPSVNLGWVNGERDDDEMDVPDVTKYINRHVFWDEAGIDQEEIEWDIALEGFTYWSLYRPIIIAYSKAGMAVTPGHLIKYETFCDTWGIPR